MTDTSAMNPIEPPSVVHQVAGHMVEPDDQTLLLYLIEPEQLTLDQRASLLNWLSVAPDHAERLAALAAQVCDLVDHVRDLPIGTTNVVEIAKPFTSAHWRLWVATAASVLVAVSWFYSMRSSSTRLNDEVAIAWANHHDSQVISGTELWSSERWTDSDVESFPELSSVDHVNTDSSFALEQGEQGIGFSDSDPPEWLVAAFVENDLGDDFNASTPE